MNERKKVVRFYIPADYLQTNKTYYIPDEIYFDEYHEAILLEILGDFVLVRSQGREITVSRLGLYLQDIEIVTVEDTTFEN